MSSREYSNRRERERVHPQVDDITMQAYISQVFPSPIHLFSPYRIEDWITQDSLNLFLEYYDISHRWEKNGVYEPIAGDIMIMRNVNPNILDAYRKFILPSWLYQSSCFSYNNLHSWFSAKHFAEYLEKVYPLQSTEDDSLDSEAGESSDDNSVQGSIGRHPSIDASDAGAPTEPESGDEFPQYGFFLPEFAESNPFVIPLPIPTNSNNAVQSQQVEKWCILPDLQVYVWLYFLNESNYTQKSLMEFYDSHQDAYFVPANSRFALENIVKVGEVAERMTYNRIRQKPLYPAKYCKTLDSQRCLELQAVLNLIEIVGRRKRGLKGRC